MGAEPSLEPVDLAYYPDTDDMGEGELQCLMCELLRPLLAQFLASQGVFAHVGSDQFVYMKRGDPTVRVSPDIYILPGVSQDEVVSSWKLWELPAPPAFVLEIVSLDIGKDYQDGPARYGVMGVEELIVFDPGAPVEGVVRREVERVRFQVFRRERDGFIRVLATNDDRVPSRYLGAWIRCVGEDNTQRLRIGVGEDGDTLVPTADERADAERLRADAEKLRADDLERQVQALLEKLGRAPK